LPSFFPALLSAVAGWYGAAGFLHPEKRALTLDMTRDSNVTFAQIDARSEELTYVRLTARPCAAGKCALQSPTVPGYWYFTESRTTATG
jgi:hypothetical protein